MPAYNFYEFAVAFYNHVIRLAEGFDRLDVVFDRYFKSNSKVKIRKGQGSTAAQVLQISDDVPFPRNSLTLFLCHTDNKYELRLYSASKIVSIHSDVGNTHLLLCAPHHNCVISFPPTVNDIVFQISSTAQETNQKIIRQALYCIKVGYSFIEIESIDTDLLILLLAYIAMELVSDNDSFNLYFQLVTPNPTWCNILSLVEHLTIDVCKASLYFYALTGCDTVSSFSGKGKYTFFDAWIESKKKKDLTKTFFKLGNMPVLINSDDKNTQEFLVKSVYFENVKDIEILVAMK